MPILWSDDYSVGISDIDAQHLHFLSLLNHLTKLAQDDPKNQATSILFYLRDYAEDHFTLEENYFKQCHFPGSYLHKRQHDHFRKKIQQIIHEFIQNDVYSKLRLLDYMQEWFLHHILIEDKKYTQCFHSSGIH